MYVKRNNEARLTNVIVKKLVLHILSVCL